MRSGSVSGDGACGDGSTAFPQKARRTYLYFVKRNSQIIRIRKQITVKIFGTIGGCSIIQALL